MTVEFKGQIVPKFITEGFHSRFIFPIANEVCQGDGFDIGCSTPDWAFPHSQPIDITINDEFNALNLPNRKVDYIFSSHCLEHLEEDPEEVLNYWIKFIKPGGKLFLYLPHHKCLYWRPDLMPTKKHIRQLYAKDMKRLFYKLDMRDIFSSECDLAMSFSIYGTT